MQKATRGFVALGMNADPCQRPGRTKPLNVDVERIVTTIFDEISTALARGDRVELRGFGAFSVKSRDARQGRNDQDLMFGTISIPESVEYLYTTFVRDYRGYYSQSAARGEAAMQRLRVPAFIRPSTLSNRILRSSVTMISVSLSLTWKVSSSIV